MFVIKPTPVIDNLIIELLVAEVPSPSLLRQHDGDQQQYYSQ